VTTSFFDQSRFKSALEELIEAFVAEEEMPLRPPAVIGDDDHPLEHTVRKFFLDRVLGALGWNFQARGENVAEEARIRGDTTLFLDYLGIHTESRTPLLIFEAKAWDKPPVQPSRSTAAGLGRSKRPSDAGLLAAGLEFCKGLSTSSPVTSEWTESLEQLRDYVRSVHGRSGHIVSRVAISSGQWLVIFTDVENAFLGTERVNSESILVYRIGEYVTQSDHIFGHLAYGRLAVSFPPFLRPSQLTAYAVATGVRRIFRALWVKRHKAGSVFDAHPQLLVYPALLIERSDDALLTVVDHSLGRETVPYDVTRLSDHLDIMREKSERLLQLVIDELPGVPAPSARLSFPGFSMRPLPGNSTGLAAMAMAPRFINAVAASRDEFLLVTGSDTHFLLLRASVAACLGHDWQESKNVGAEVGPSALYSPSVHPASFYPSGSDHHCAHRVIHGRRPTRCHVRPFEEFLCCRACVFQSDCWSLDESAALPCGSVPTV
jgi:hypothetical protein